MNINHNRLVPGGITYWGDIVGNLTDQKDLVDYISTHGGGGGGGGDAVWGSITGNLSDQTDLMNKLSEFATEQFVTSALSGYATESWVSSQGYLTEVPSGYATESWVASQGYQTELEVNAVVIDACGKAESNVQDWVASQGYLTEVPSGYATESFVTSALSGYATESWVVSQGYQTAFDVNEVVIDACGKAEGNVMEWVQEQSYLTSSALSGYATESYVTAALSDYATQSWVIGQSYYQNDGTLDPLIYREQLEGGYLKYNCILRGNALNWKTFSAAPSQAQAGKFVYMLNGEAYGFEPSTGKLYVWDNTACEFVFYANTTGHNGEQYVLWNDNDGNVFFGNAYTVDLYMKEDETQVTFTPHSMGGTYQPYQWSKHNICRRGGDLYMIVRDMMANDGTGTAYVYNPLTMEFDSSLPCTGIPENNWYIYTNDYENTTFYTRNGSMYLPEEYYDKDLDEITSIFFTPASAFPASFTYKGDTYNIEGNRCIRYGNNVYFYIERSTKILFKYDWGNTSLGWVPYGDHTNLLPFYIEPGITVKDNGVFDDANGVMFGFCSKSGKTGQIGVWNFGETNEEYGWDNTVDSRLDAIESSYITSSALSGYATESYVQNQGYITSSALSGYATQSWVSSQGFTTSSNVQSIVNDMNCIKLVDIRGVDSIVDRPNDYVNPGGYNTQSYVLGLLDEGGEHPTGVGDIKYRHYVYVDGPEIVKKTQKYIEDGGEWVLDREYEGYIPWSGAGWIPVQIHDLLNDPFHPEYEDELQGFPIDRYVEVDGTAPFGKLDDFGGKFEFHGIKLDFDTLGKYKIECIEEDPENAPGEITYNETFIPFVAAEEPDTSTNATYVLKATVLNGEITYEWVPTNV